MMFGQHDEHKEEHDAPKPDGHLGDVSTGDNGAVLPAPSDDNNDFIMTDTPAAAPADDTAAAPSAPVAPTPQDANGLLDIKQQALHQLSPLLDHLDQTPEEKFRTTMMLIQAADNDALIKTAYDAAQAITDEKVKAQALLDIVNEINYFTQRNSTEA